jgi:protein-S-isoprenylcysteine O-methyltransferase Ste14
LALIFANPNWKLFISGILIIVLGEIMRIWGVGYAGSATRTRTVGADVLVTNGPFAYLRNPLYFGNILIYVGFTVLSGLWFPYMTFVVLLFFLIQYTLIVNLEEEFLKEKFGEVYIDYSKNVPRFIPRPVPYQKRSNFDFNLKSALQSERRTLQAHFLLLTAICIRWYFID